MASQLAEKLYRCLPPTGQDLAVTAFNLQYYRRRGGEYARRKAFHSELYAASPLRLSEVQTAMLKEILAHTHRHSRYYKELWGAIDVSGIRAVGDLRILPMVTKEDLRSNVRTIATVEPGRAYVSHTGGTTGKSLEVYFTWPDVQERMAVLDSFREREGWRLGKRTAWFSGKTILTSRDERARRFWKTDRWFNIRYYSTFHLSQTNIPAYLDNLDEFKPEYFSGFASNMFALADYARRNGRKLRCAPQAVFTTAETLVPEQTRVIEEAFRTKVFDQYASSEGAPFIVQCAFRKYHFLPATGVIELLDESGEPAQEGEAVITSFHSHGTPLVRYRIGDAMRWGAPVEEACACGSWCPIVESIQGRVLDCLYSRERGRINLGNVSNCVKHTPNIRQFQAVQAAVDAVDVSLVVDREGYTNAEEATFLRELRDRLGERIEIRLHYVDEIPRERSGKVRIVKNSVPADEMR